MHYDRPASSIGEPAQRYMRRLDIWQDAIAAVLTKARDAGRLRLEVPAALLARVLFDIHLVEVRRWMNAEQPDPAQGQAMLRRMFAAVLQNRLTAA